MKIESENMKERVATEELVRELLRDDARRGEFMIMSDDEDEERFVQIACDYDEVGGKSDGLFDLEYRDGKNGYLYHCSRRVSADGWSASFSTSWPGASSGAAISTGRVSKTTRAVGLFHRRPGCRQP